MSVLSGLHPVDELGLFLCRLAAVKTFPAWHSIYLRRHKGGRHLAPHDGIGDHSPDI